MPHTRDKINKFVELKKKNELLSIASLSFLGKTYTAVTRPFQPNKYVGKF